MNANRKTKSKKIHLEEATVGNEVQEEEKVAVAFAKSELLT
jgi:hypothetical protein